MPTITAQKIVNDAKTILQETTGIRWPDAELLGWVSAGQREIVMLVPSANPVTTAFTAAPNTTRQFIPSDGYQFLDVVSNGQGQAVTGISKALIETLRRSWRTDPGTLYPIHYVFDPRQPRCFHLYPFPIAGAVVELTYSAAPAELTSLGQVIALDDLYANPLLDYVLYRAYSKDLETVGSAERAVAHRTAFENTLGLRAQAMASNQPVPSER